jgi:hypothetical protein
LILIGASSIFSAGTGVLYSNLDKPAFPGKTIFPEFIMKLLSYILESIYPQTSPSSNTVSFDINSTSSKSISQKL